MAQSPEKFPDKSLARDKEASLTPDQEKEYQALSPFELKNQLIQYAQEYETTEYPYINAGRGNPNFFNTTARLALTKLMEFAVSVSPGKIKLESEYPGLAYFPVKEGIYKKFTEHIDEKDFLYKAMEKAIDICYPGISDPDKKDEVVFELTNSCLGDFYPDPPRIYPNVEKIVNDYLNNALLGDTKTAGTLPDETDTKSDGVFQLFATEGTTAGMIYVFKSLEENFLLNKRDKAAIITPVFSPYLEIPS